MTYHPPRHLLEVLQKIEDEEGLVDGDPRYVETRQARGSEKPFIRLARKFGWDPESNAIRQAGATLAMEGRANRVQFWVDGTDKMRREDTQKFFVQDADQLHPAHAAKAGPC